MDETTHTTHTDEITEGVSADTTVQKEVHEIAEDAAEVALSEEVLDITPLDQNVVEEGIASV